MYEEQREEGEYIPSILYPILGPSSAIQVGLMLLSFLDQMRAVTFGVIGP